MVSPTSSDSELVARAISGESEAFAGLYNRYFPSVYDFLHRTMRNADEAADVAQDTFLKAMESLRSLSDAGAFKSWLFSIAHHQALNRLERERRFIEPSPAWSEEEQPETDPIFSQVDSDRLANPEEAAEMQETALLVWEAAASLDKRTYAVLDLHVRQGLESAEIAEVLGVSSGNAYTLLHRLKRSLEEAIGSYLLIRRGSRRCEILRQMVELFAIPPVTLEMRKTVERHVRKCDLCTETKRTLMAPLAVFGAFAAVPAPAGLQEHIWGNLSGIWSQAGPPSYSSQSGSKSTGGGEGGGIRKTFSGASRWSGRNYVMLLCALLLAGGATLFLVMFSFSLPGKSSSSPIVATVHPTMRPTITRAPTRTATPTVISTSTSEATITPSPAATQQPPTATATKMIIIVTPPVVPTSTPNPNRPTHTPVPPTPTFHYP